MSQKLETLVICHHPPPSLSVSLTQTERKTIASPITPASLRCSPPEADQSVTQEDVNKCVHFPDDDRLEKNMCLCVYLRGCVCVISFLYGL